jgi:hypothetical protein
MRTGVPPEAEDERLQPQMMNNYEKPNNERILNVFGGVFLRTSEFKSKQ